MFIGQCSAGILPACKQDACATKPEKEKGDAILTYLFPRLKKSGAAKCIFEKWFGPQSETPIKRDFGISPEH